MTIQERFRKLIKEHGLLILMFGLFLIFLAGLSITGYSYNNEELQLHGQETQSFVGYVGSGEFIEAVFENWESEFLQMAALVIATVFLYQKGSADSKKLRGKNEVDTSSRYSIINASSWNNRKKAAKGLLYDNSLSLALILLFVISFGLHAVGGVEAHNEEAEMHGESTYSLVEYIGSSKFWFESFQNWQSEFLAVGMLILLSIYLRQRGSPQSKPIGEQNKKTGA